MSSCLCLAQLVIAQCAVLVHSVCVCAKGSCDLFCTLFCATAFVLHQFGECLRGDYFFTKPCVTSGLLKQPATYIDFGILSVLPDSAGPHYSLWVDVAQSAVGS